MENKFVTIKEAAKMLGVTVLTLRNWDNNGKFTAGRHPISNYRVYKIDDINNLIEMIGNSSVSRVSRANTAKKLSVRHLD